MKKRTDREADLSSTDDSTLEMNQSEREGLWDLFAFPETYCEHVFEPRNNVRQEQPSLNHNTENINTGCQIQRYKSKEK